MKPNENKLLSDVAWGAMSPNVPEDVPLWTPDLVKKALAQAVRFAAVAAGATGPRAMGSVNLGYELEYKEQAARALGLTAAEVTRLEDALLWQMRYLSQLPGPATVLKHWLRAKATRRPFGAAIKSNGWAARTAHRSVDRALGRIAIGLNADGVPVWYAD